MISAASVTTAEPTMSHWQNLARTPAVAPSVSGTFHVGEAVGRGARHGVKGIVVLVVVLPLRLPRGAQHRLALVAQIAQQPRGRLRMRPQVLSQQSCVF